MLVGFRALVSMTAEGIYERHSWFLITSAAAGSDSALLHQMQSAAEAEHSTLPSAWHIDQPATSDHILMVIYA